MMANRMLRRHILLTILVLCLAASLLAGCGEKAAEQTAPSEEGIRIGITFDSFVIERWQRERDIFVSAATELGASVNVQVANGDIDEQIRQIEYFIEKNVDVIVVVQVADDNKDLKEVIVRAKKAGIPVIAYDRLILDSDVDLYISFDNQEVGRLMARHMAEHIGSGTILMVCGPLSDYNVVQVDEGFRQVMKELGDPLNIAGKYHAPGWLAETGFDATTEYLEGHAVPAGIMSGNDSIAGQVVKALAQQRYAGSICVVGQDADLDACQRIVEGTQCMTVYKPVEILAKTAAACAVEMAEKKEISASCGTIFDGTQDVPYCSLAPIAVTADNMDEYITGKYHEAGDIYLNVRDENSESGSQ